MDTIKINIYPYSIRFHLNMKKFIVETYYTCTFKTVHTLNDLNDKELSKVDQRTDGDVEVIDVKLNNRKTKKIGEKNQKIQAILKQKTMLALKCQIEEKVTFKRRK